jgi:hypothetical protein
VRSSLLAYQWHQVSEKSVSWFRSYYWGPTHEHMDMMKCYHKPVLTKVQVNIYKTAILYCCAWVWNLVTHAREVRCIEWGYFENRAPRRIFGSKNGEEAENKQDYHLLGYDTVSFGTSLSTLRGDILHITEDSNLDSQRLENPKPSRGASQSLKSSVVWDITPCSPVKVNRRIGGSYGLHLQGLKLNQARN